MGRSSRPAIAVALVALCALILLHAWGRASAWGNVPLGTKIPELTLTSTSGKQVKVSARGSKATLLIYLRPNHARSAAALADLVKLYARYRGKGVRAFAVSTVRTEGAALKKLAAKLRVPFPVLIDSKERFYGTYGVFVHPTTGVIDGKGILRYEYSSHRPGYAIAVERQLKAVLGLGPAPESIKEVDRNASTAEQRSARRKSLMERMRQKIELKRAERRFVAARALLAPSSLPRVLELYRAWAALLPLPSHEKLAAAAEKIRGGKEVEASLVALKPLLGDAKLRPTAQLWLGRALIKIKRLDRARASLQACAKAGDPRGQCAFELAALDAGDAAKAVARCKQGFDAAFGGE